jgi:hypothetical protein
MRFAAWRLCVKYSGLALSRGDRAGGVAVGKRAHAKARRRKGKGARVARRAKWAARHLRKHCGATAAAGGPCGRGELEANWPGSLRNPLEHAQPFWLPCNHRVDTRSRSSAGKMETVCAHLAPDQLCDRNGRGGVGAGRGRDAHDVMVDRVGRCGGDFRGRAVTAGNSPTGGLGQRRNRVSGVRYWVARPPSRGCRAGMEFASEKRCRKWLFF